MAPPPAKKQKRRVVISSDDEEGGRSVVSKTQERGDWGTTTESASIGIAQNVLPTRSRTKIASATRQTAARVSPKRPPRKQPATVKKATSKSISTFFNSVDQAQLLNRQPPRARTPKTENEVEDVIEDDSPIEELEESRGTQGNTGLVLDRRKRTWEKNLPSGSQRFRLAGKSTSDAIRPAETGKVDPRPWAERFGPMNLEELVVHKRKVLDVRNWLENVQQGRDRKRLLILRGPSGTGKTATVSTLAETLDFDISEWRNPVGTEYSSEGYLSMSAQFEEFVSRSGKYSQLEFLDSTAKTTSSSCTGNREESNRKKVILLEEFPNTFLSTSNALQSFRSSILQFLAISTPSMEVMLSKTHIEDLTPLIMIVTETRLTTPTAASDSFTAHRLLGSDILNHRGVSVIDFNPIAPTLLTKALDLVIQKEARQSGRRRVPGPSVLKKLGEVGDVRSAIGSLEFLCLRGEDNDDWGGRVASRGKRGVNSSQTVTKMEKLSLEMVTQRESSLGLFHAVGKVVYNKRNDATEPLTQPPNDSAGSARFRVSQVSVDQLIDEIGTDIDTFVAALHENYALSCEGYSFADTIDSCLEALCDSDMLGSSRSGRFGSRREAGSRPFQGASSDSQRQDEISFQLAVRGLLYALPDPVNRKTYSTAGKGTAKNDTYKMFYPTSMRLLKQMEEIDSLVDRWTDRFHAGITPLGQPTRIRSHQFVDPGSEHAKFTPRSAEKYLQKYDHEETEPFRANLNSTKAELILERLPYVMKIEQQKPGSIHVRELERITQFHGVIGLSDEAPDEECKEDSVTVVDWTSDRPANLKPESTISLQRGVGQVGNKATSVVFPKEDDLEKMYLSDDDIED